MIYFFDDYKNLIADRFLPELPEERAKKYHRLKRDSDKNNCVIAYLLLKHALQQNGIDSFEIETGTNGKPYLKNIDIHFNISHCAEGVAVAVDDSMIGIDIQEKSEFKEKVAMRFFTESEYQKIKNSEDRAESFIRIWTLKESVIKCFGKALANLNDYSFENYENYFEKFDKKFSCLSEKNILISVCGNKYFDKINIVKTEDLT